MQDVYEVLKEKEIAIEKLRQEVAALRVVCQMLGSEQESVPEESGVERSRVEPEQRLNRADQRELSLARIRARLDSAGPKSAPSKASALLQFKKAAMSASHALVSRFLEFRSREAEPQRKTFRYLFERLGRSSAA